jgi:hypothetical protein
MKTRSKTQPRFRRAGKALCAAALLGQLLWPARAAGRRIAPQGPAGVAACAGGWSVEPLIENFVAEDLAVDAAGSLFLTGVALEGDGSGRLGTVRSTDGGASWELVDDYAVAPPLEAGGHALYVDADGAVYALGWERDADGQRYPILRKSASGDFGSWWTSFRGEPAMNLGAVAGGAQGTIYLALGYAGSQGTGWVLESSLAGQIPWTVEDDFRVSDLGIAGAQPYAIAADGAGGLLVVGQLNGSPDRWVVRYRPEPGAEWTTIDLFEYTASSYGLAAATAAITADQASGPLVLVAGFGVRGSGSDDYHWLVRRAPLDAFAAGPDPKAWNLDSYQLEEGRHASALDSAVDAQGRVLVAGTAVTSEGLKLLLRRTADGGRNWDNLLELPMITDNWRGAVAVGPDGRYRVAGVVGERTVVASCTPAP